MPHLLFYRDGQEVLRFPLTADEITIGRSSENDISLPNPQVSRFHARLRKVENIYQLINTSRVGTRVGGSEIEQFDLKDQDVFEIGPWRILYEMNAAEEEKETAIVEASDGGQAGAPGALLAISSAMKPVFERIEKSAQIALPVMIQGETGVGKELVARAIHSRSGRSGAFVALNCGAISPHLIESELFGHERGAFTGAVALHHGAFEQAEGGTLFLDEIAELPYALQPKLLRVLEESCIKRVGGIEEIAIDVRIVAATHRDLREEVEAKTFREDLYYRLMGLPIEIPPLRDRIEDIPLLAKHFIAMASPVQLCKEISNEAMERLRSHSWPGNVREFKNVIVRSVLLCPGSVIGEEDIQFLGRKANADGMSLGGAEKDAIVSALKASEGNKRAAADRLGIAKSTLFRKLKEYGLAD